MSDVNRNSNFDDPAAAWRACERAWAQQLRSMGYAIVPLHEAVGNVATTKAPMLQTPDGLLRAPDFQTYKNGVTAFWEVKYRSRSEIDPTTGVREHWMPVDNFGDYLKVARVYQCEVWVVIYEARTSLSDGRWLRINVRKLRDAGYRSRRTVASGETVDAWAWPLTAMEVVEGPEVHADFGRTPVLPVEGDRAPISAPILELAERTRRKKSEASPTSVTIDEQTAAGEDLRAALDLLARELEVGRDVLCDRLGLPARPRYSLLRSGPLPAAEATDDLLQLLRYGIRVFLVVDKPLSSRSLTMTAEEIAGFEAARLLEVAVVPDLDADVHWLVDGAAALGAARHPGLVNALRRADAVGGVNVQQYDIVHAPATCDIVVSAGAGTGKTETMAERLVFLLATDDAVEDVKGELRPAPLTADQVAFVTFTREAAKEMRARLSRTLMLRRRLCSHCVLPALPWLMQLANAEITTIHGFAKRLINVAGGAVGFGPEAAVSRLTLDFRGILLTRLSSRLAALMEEYGGTTPGAHQWQRHLTSVWDALDNNGVSLMNLAGPNGLALDWGSASDALSSRICDATRDVLTDVAADFSDLCRREQTMPTSQLVPLALASVVKANTDRLPPLRHVFVDEFQDTDAQQMELATTIRQRIGARLFVVGDEKQGIYRFRGAEGNAFSEISAMTDRQGAPPFSTYSLTKNFRTGGTLLDSLHDHFAAWGADGLLNYSAASHRLRPGRIGPDESKPIGIQRSGSKSAQLRAMVPLVSGWRAVGPDEAIAILCRRNSEAIDVQRALRAAGLACRLSVGGSFFLTPAVREARALLEALAAPHERAALLELAETRWGWGVLCGPAPDWLSESDAAIWQNATPDPLPWRDRVAALPDGGSLAGEDLVPLRARVDLLRSSLSHRSVLGLLVDCVTRFAPDGVATFGDDAAESRRYARCLDHLITLLDGRFADGAASLEAVLTWLRLQIATNRVDDEPDNSEDEGPSGETIALTVHKAKGLEFDRVVIPFSGTPFGTTYPGTSATIVRTRGRSEARILWQWRGELGFQNYSATEEVAQVDQIESVREEARLLYVAATRARKELVVLGPKQLQDSGGGTPASWAHLLAMSGGA